MKAGIIFVVAGIMFAYAETWYFGWNRLPMSSAEFYCDKIATAVSVWGYSLIWHKIKKERKK